jgi:hypothetical protein
VLEVVDGRARQDQELEGEAYDTQFRHVWTAMYVVPYALYVVCVIPYILYFVYLLIDCVIVDGVLALPYMFGGQGYKSVGYRSTSRVQIGEVYCRLQCMFFMF